MKTFVVLLTIIVLSFFATANAAPPAKVPSEFEDVNTYYDGKVMVPYGIIGDAFAIKPDTTWVTNEKELGDRIFKHENVANIVVGPEQGLYIVHLQYPTLQADKDAVEAITKQIKEKEEVVANLYEKIRVKEDELARKTADFTGLDSVTEDKIKELDALYVQLFKEESNKLGEISQLKSEIDYARKVPSQTEDGLKNIAEKEARIKEIQQELEKAHDAKVDAYIKRELAIIAFNQELVKKINGQLGSLTAVDEKTKAETARLRKEIAKYETKIKDSEYNLTNIKNMYITEINNEIAALQTELSLQNKELIGIQAKLANKMVLLLEPLMKKIKEEGYAQIFPIIYSEDKTRILTNQFQVRFTPHAFTNQFTLNKKKAFIDGVTNFNRKYNVEAKMGSHPSFREYTITVYGDQFEVLRISKIYAESGEVEGVWLKFIEMKPAISVKASVNVPGISFGSKVTFKLEVVYDKNKIQLNNFTPDKSMALPKIWRRDKRSTDAVKENIVHVDAPVVADTADGKVATWDILFQQEGEMILPSIKITYTNMETKEEGKIESNEVRVKIASNVSFREDYANMTDVRPVTWNTDLEYDKAVYPYAKWMRPLGICSIIASSLAIVLLLLWPKKKQVAQGPDEFSVLSNKLELLKNEKDPRKFLGFSLKLVEEMLFRFPNDPELIKFKAKYEPELTKPEEPKVSIEDVKALFNHLKALAKGVA